MLLSHVGPTLKTHRQQQDTHIFFPQTSEMGIRVRELLLMFLCCVAVCACHCLSMYPNYLDIITFKHNCVRKKVYTVSPSFLVRYFLFSSSLVNVVVLYILLLLSICTKCKCFV